MQGDGGKMLQPIWRWAVAGLGPLLLTACMQWQAQWPADRTPPHAVAHTELALRLEAARASENRAVDHEGLKRAMAAQESVLQVAPYEYRALVALSNQSILLGAAFDQTTAERSDSFRRAMRLAERAMYTNPQFRRLVDAGVPPWEASAALGQREMEAMMFWSTAVLYQFKDVMGWPAKIANVRWIKRIGPFLMRMQELDPDWGGGAIQFSLSLYYGILPGFMGGDTARSDALLDEAVRYGAPWMLSRWGRAKYFQVRDGNRDGFRSDCEWVIARDPAASGEAFYWRVYFRRDARQMLADIEKLF
jgi:hypothetical protein